MKDICPEGCEDTTEYIMDAIDWEANYDPNFKEHYFRPSVQLESTQDGLIEKWVCYGNDFVSAKEVTILPGKEITLTDKAAYGCVIVQGFGKFGDFDAEAVNMMRVGDQTADEYFVSKAAAQKGIRICNRSTVEPLVILQHFGPDNTFDNK